MENEVIVARGFKCDYWAGHITYRGKLYDEKTDKSINYANAIWKHLRTLTDGDIVEIVVRRIGKCPLVDDK